MRRILSVLLCLGMASTSLLADTAAERLGQSATILKEVLAAPDKGIPEDLLRKAHCVVVVPGVKQGAFIVGAKYGRGFLICRTADGRWGAPGALRIEGGSVGFQIGGSETDVIMLVMDERSMKGILSSKFTLGGAADVAAGPVGRSSTAQTDATMNAKILSYSRSRGVFAGVALTGASLRQDLDQNTEMYGTPIPNDAVVSTKPKPPAGAAELLAVLGKYPAAGK